MATEESASMDAALNDVFASGRGRGDPAPVEEVATTPAPEAAPVSKEAEPQAKAETERDDPVDHNKQVSVKEVFEEREKKRAYKAQFEAEQKRAGEFAAQLKALQEQNAQLIQHFSRPQQAPANPQQQPQRQHLPDPNQDPLGYLHGLMQQQRAEMAERQAALEEQQEKNFLNHSEDKARTKYGDEAVDAAIKFSTQLSESDKARLRAQRHPFDELVKWHQSHETLNTIGGDLNGFLSKREEAIRAKILDDLKAGRLSVNGAAAQPAPQPQQFPGTLAAATHQGPTGQITKTLEAAVGDVLATDRKARGNRR